MGDLFMMIQPQDIIRERLYRVAEACEFVASVQLDQEPLAAYLRLSIALGELESAMWSLKSLLPPKP
jgi:hypothetical protein